MSDEGRVPPASQSDGSPPGDQERNGAAGGGSGPAQGQGQEGAALQDSSEESEPEAPRITLDYYYSTRRRPSTSSWPYLVSMVLMLATLILLIVYQDKCGMLASQVLFGVGGP